MKRVTVVLGCALLAMTAVSAQSQYRYREPGVETRRTPPARATREAELTVEEAVIRGGRLLVSGRTAKPNQVVEIVNTGDKTISLRSRRFSFALPYIPENCRIHLRSGSENLTDQVVSACVQGARDGKDGAPGRDGRDGKDGAPGIAGKDGRDGRDGKDGRDAFVYGSLPGDGTANKCWPSDLIGLWFIRDYPAPNSRTIAHIAPDRAAGGNGMNVTEPGDPLKSEKDGHGVTQSAEFEAAQLHIVSRETRSRNGVRGEVAADCKSIVWKSGAGVLRTWER